MDIERPKSRQPIPPHAEKVFEGVVFDIYQWQQELYDGSMRTFEKAKRDDTIVVVPSTPDKKLIFLRDEQPQRDPVMTFPAGRMDMGGEDPLTTAKRELLEETGYASEDWTLWKAFQPVTKVEWAVYVFIAKNCVKVQEPDPGPGEKIEMSLVTLDDVIAHVEDPTYQHEEMATTLMKAKYDPAARAELERVFFG